MRPALRKGVACCELVASYSNVTRPALRASASAIPPTRRLRPTPTFPAPCLSRYNGHVRAFHVSPAVQKKKKAQQEDDGHDKKRGKKGGAPPPPASNERAEGEGGKHPQPNPEDPGDFADVESRMQPVDEHHTRALQRLRAGGRFNPDSIGNLKVQPDKAEAAVYKLSELAQVVPRGGRAVSILVHEERYIKPILSAVQASPDFNQQPQRDEENELELTLKIEAEDREDMVKRIKGTCHDWREKIRALRQKRDKVHAKWKSDKVILPDLKRKLDTELDKLIKAKIAEVDKAEKETVKAIEAK